MQDLLKHNRTEIQHMMVQSGSAVPSVMALRPLRKQSGHEAERNNANVTTEFPTTRQLYVPPPTVHWHAADLIPKSRSKSATCTVISDGTRNTIHPSIMSGQRATRDRGEATTGQDQEVTVSIPLGVEAAVTPSARTDREEATQQDENMLLVDQSEVCTVACEGEDLLNHEHSEPEWTKLEARFQHTNFMVTFSIDEPTILAPHHGY
ncbi:hypothetical protein GQ600_17635 [Phytophthora cactorum]|nr:hypothetical protein GQ600_17635 [Phytophthora cactorum]